MEQSILRQFRFRSDNVSEQSSHDPIHERQAALGQIMEEATVTYSVKELLSRIETRIIENSTETKTALEYLRQEVDSLKAFRERILGFSIALSLLSGGAAGYLVVLVTGK